MARKRTLSQLITDVRQRADLVSSQFVTDLELTEYINQSTTELYDLLVEARGQDYYEATTTITTVAGQPEYPLPDDFYQLILAEVDMGGRKLALVPYMRSEHARYSFTPLGGGRTIKLYYVPACPRLVSDGDKFDGINGWEEYVVVDAAMKALEKEESDVQTLMMRKAQLTDRIKGLAPQRDAGMPPRIQDVGGPSQHRRSFTTGTLYYRMRGSIIEFLESLTEPRFW